MQEFWEFAVNNWPLALTFLLIAGWWIGAELWYYSSGVKVADPEAATRLYNREGAKFVDVRPGKEFGEARLPGAFNLPEREFDQVIGKLRKEVEIDTPVIVYDADGMQANRTARKLKKQGYATVYRMKGGFKAWQSAGYPMDEIRQKGQKGGKG